MLVFWILVILIITIPPLIPYVSYKMKEIRVSKSIILRIYVGNGAYSLLEPLSHNEKVRFKYQNQSRTVQWFWQKLFYCIIESKEGILLVHRFTNKIEEYPNVDALPDQYKAFKEWRSKMILLKDFTKEESKYQIAKG